jgi:predicted secreted hydrolase
MTPNLLVRRHWLRQTLGGAGAIALAPLMLAHSAWAQGATPLQPRPLRFPADHGAHPAQRTEWWYVTGWLAEAGTAAASTTAAPRWGFQLTFFRSRTQVDPAQPSAFAAHQLILAHAALSDLRAGRLLHDQRIARAGFGLAGASENDTNVHLRDWQLQRDAASGAYRARLVSRAAGFALDLRLQPSQPLLLQGEAGWSRKGPQPQQASLYYSQPQLGVSGQFQRTDGGTAGALAVQGRAWLDHEWSDSVLAADAVGWDWIGINWLDGSALTAFRLRRADGSALWAGGSWRGAGSAAARVFAPGEVRFTPLRSWRSPATGTSYPVEWSVQTPAGTHRLRALLDAQELDSRQSTGTIYWEGLSELLDAAGRRVGLGYLELTGYAGALQF